MNNKVKIAFFLISLFLISQSFAEKIIFSANRMTGQAGSKNTATKLSGNAYVRTGTMEIQADELELSGDDFRYIKASGNIAGKNLESNMDFTCDSLEYDRITKVAVLKGNVNLTDKDNDVKAEAQIIEYNQKKETAILQIQIKLTQKENVCSSSYAVYYKARQILELSGNAQVNQKDDVFRAQYITFDMNTQDITLGGNVKGKVTDTKTVEDSEDAQAKEASANSDDSEKSEETQTSENENENGKY